MTISNDRETVARSRRATALNLNDVIRNVVAAIATAVGVVGLLAVVGGAVTWLRFSQTGLPTQTALSVTPKHDLISLGATGLVIFVGLATLIVAGLFAINPTGEPGRWTRVVAALLVVGAFYYVVLASDFERRSEAILLVAAAALAVGCLRVASATDDRFVPFGLAVFFAVLLFGAAVTYRKESDHPSVQPAAVLQGKAQDAFVGYFVAATDDRIYLARLTDGDEPGALYDVKRDAETRLAVGRRLQCESGHGPNVQCAAAATAAAALAHQLLLDRAASKEGQ